MAGPIITALLSPNPASGTATTDGTEQTLASASAAAGTYVLRLDVHNMVDGDTIEVRGYTSSDAANQRVCMFYSKANLQTLAVDVGPPIPTADYIKFTIKRVGGTDRAYAWSVIN